MLLRLTLTVALVCVCMCGCVNAAGRVTRPKSYGVKLCGREFIRAVIFTCGGSRWRRSVDLDPFQMSNSEGDNQLTWQDGLELATYKRSPPQTSSSYSLADLLVMFGALGDGQDNQSAAAGLQGRDPAWATANRRKRNFSLGVAGLCCKEGCTKNDIGGLC